MHITEPNRHDRRAMARAVGITPARFKEVQDELSELGFIKVHPNPSGEPFRSWFMESDYGC